MTGSPDVVQAIRYLMLLAFWLWLFGLVAFGFMLADIRDELHKLADRKEEREK